MATAHPGIPREVDRYLVPAEKVIFITRLHLISLVEPIITVIGGFVLLALADSVIPKDAAGLRNGLFIAWLVVLARLLYMVIDWYFRIFLSTDKRLILVQGIIWREVNMMPVSKVTDMRYDQSIPGRIIGYGKFVLESAGQDQALSVVNFVPNADSIYRKINATLFLKDSAAATRPAPTGTELPVQEPGQTWWNR